MSPMIACPWWARWMRAAVRVVALVVAVGYVPTAGAQLLSEGPRHPGAVASDGSFGTSPWTNPGNAASSNDTYAVTAPGGVPTQYLLASNFGFAIPSPATIAGIEVTVERQSSAGTIVDNRARIVKGGVVGATDLATVDVWPITDTIVTYGSDSELWGETWTPADVNDPGFGFALAVTDNVDTAGVDDITITVYYSLCGAAPSGGCRLALKSLFLVKDVTPDLKDKMVWKWVVGASTGQADFADPLTTATFALCMYADGGSTFLAQTLVPPNATTWAPISTSGYKYIDKLGTEDGIQKIVLKGSLIDKAKAIVKGKGDNLPTITPPLTTPVVVQLVNSDTGICWEATYNTTLSNQIGLFKAKFP
jgi:hypothetical protein